VSIVGRIIRAIRGNASDEDPDKFVELLTVPLVTSELLLHGLTDRGIPARGHPTFNIVTDVISDSRIMVRRKDIVAAMQAMKELGFANG